MKLGRIVDGVLEVVCLAVTRLTSVSSSLILNGIISTGQGKMAKMKRSQVDEGFCSLVS